MGGVISTSVPIEAEKLTWIMPHKLVYNQILRQQQLADLDNFGSNLKLCSVQGSYGGFGYRHWFVTDGRWFIEFGGGELGNCPVKVHADSTGYVNAENNNNLYIVHDIFSLTDEVKDRMRAVCGASNYSLCLRNCEHLARYIHCGSWVSFQMASGGGGIRDYLKSYLSANHTKLINTLPDNLKVETRLSMEKIYSQCLTHVQYLNTAEVLNKYDDKCYSVLFLGPTGCGKSRLINLLFNQEVSRSEPTAMSVTKDVVFLQGEYQRHLTLVKGGGDRSLTVNMIDTIGLCDSVMSGHEVYNWIKDRVKVNMMYIDVVVVVCAGRIERIQAQSIKKYLEWLKYKDNAKNFVFIYNKADDLTSAQKSQNLLQMGEMIGVSIGTMTVMHERDYKRSVEDTFTTSFPPRAEYDTVKDDLQKLRESILRERRGRLQVDESTCSIL